MNSTNTTTARDITANIEAIVSATNGKYSVAEVATLVLASNAPTPKEAKELATELQFKAPPATTHNAVLDSEQHHCAADFLKHVDDDHLLKKLALSISKATYLPAHTTFLAGLGVFSSIASRKYLVAYPDGTGLPIGLYVVAEQPSGTAKSRCLKTFQHPFFSTEKRLKR